MYTKIANNFKNKSEPVLLSLRPALEISLETLFLFYLNSATLL